MKLIFFIFCLPLFGCSQSKKGSADRLEYDNRKEAKKVLEGDQVVCQGNCPEYVGAFYLYHSPSEGRHLVNLCSATLIAKDQVLTNKHCIEDILKEGDRCDESASIEIKFPRVGQIPIQSFKCKKILKTSKDYLISGTKARRRRVPDWAIVQLEESVKDRKPVALAAGSFADKTKVDLFPVYFDTTYTHPKGTIKAVTCTQSFNENNFFATDSESPLFEMTGCQPKLVHGNSGSGVFPHGESKLLGVMATSDSSNNTSAGTLAHCIPNFSTDSDDCFFQDDRQFTEVAKTLYYLNSHMRSEFDLAKEPFLEFNSVVRWQDKAVDGNSLRALKIGYQTRWNKLLTYLDDAGNRRLKRKLEVSLARAIFPFAPECALSEAGGEAVPVPVMNLSDWNFLDTFVHQEAPVFKDGGYSVKTHSSIPGNNILILPSMFKGTSESGGIKLQSSTGLSGAVNSIQIQLPLCH